MMTLKDSYITLRRLRFHALHGVAAQERLTGNDYEVTLRIEVDLADAARTDALSDTVNYAEAYGLVRDVMRMPCQLLEHVAWRIGESLFVRWPEIKAVDISLTKLNPPIGADADGCGVELHLINDKTER